MIILTGRGYTSRSIHRPAWWNTPPCRDAGYPPSGCWPPATDRPPDGSTRPPPDSQNIQKAWQPKGSGPADWQCFCPLPAGRSCLVLSSTARRNSALKQNKLKPGKRNKVDKNLFHSDFRTFPAFRFRDVTSLFRQVKRKNLKENHKIPLDIPERHDMLGGIARQNRKRMKQIFNNINSIITVAIIIIGCGTAGRC